EKVRQGVHGHQRDDLHDVPIRVASRTAFRSASPPFPRSARGSCTVQAFNGSRCRVRLKVYLMGVVRGLSLVSRTKTASSFAGSALLALRLIEWGAPGASDQLSPAR